MINNLWLTRNPNSLVLRALNGINMKDYIEFIQQINNGLLPPDEQRYAYNGLIYELKKDSTGKVCDAIVDASPGGSPLRAMLLEPANKSANLKTLIDDYYVRNKHKRNKTGSKNICEYKIEKMYKAGLISYPDDPADIKHNAFMFVNPKYHDVGHDAAELIARTLDVPYERIIADAIINYIVVCGNRQVDENTGKTLGGQAGSYDLHEGLSRFTDTLISTLNEKDEPLMVTFGLATHEGNAYMRGVLRFMGLPESLRDSALERVMKSGERYMTLDDRARLNEFILERSMLNDNGRPYRKRPML